jgi:radical SAM superfamily enzyme YgiQ (UPF0313 family)
MPDIVLATLNAKYIHAAFGLRCLFANLGELQGRTRLLEFDIHHRPVDVAEAILAHNPAIVGFGVYIWNVAPLTQVVAILRRLAPGVRIVVGGPEVSHETDGQAITGMADHVITGEADLAFADLCRRLLGTGPRPPHVIHAPLPDVAALRFPYEAYTQEDIAHRIVYLEASRGCPFTCEFCLSSLDVPVRQFPLEPFLSELQRLLDRGLNHFKFVDRTFNLNLNAGRRILLFFLERHQAGRFYHFEMIPDRFPPALREIVARFPPGSVQFEVGVQTLNPEVSERISRRQSVPALEENLRWLRRETGVHVHADLIVGLPGEDLDSFGRGFDQLRALEPQEIQVGILKRLRGTPIVRHDREWGMVYSPDPPYEVLATAHLTFPQMQGLRRFARYWDLVANSGNFTTSAPLLLTSGASPFRAFLAFSNWLYTQVGRTDQISLARLAELLFRYLVEEIGQDPGRAATAVWEDYRRPGRGDRPGFLAAHLPPPAPRERHAATSPRSTLRRQARHLEGGPDHPVGPGEVERP